MNVKPLILSFIFYLSMLTGCGYDAENQMNQLKIATFNVSFDRPTLAQLMSELAITPKEQQRLVDIYRADKKGMTAADLKLTESIIQIRNVAAIIQKNRPDILVLNEFNNDGIGKDTRGLEQFQSNYLSVAQSENSIDGEALLQPIHYPHTTTYATNTGLNSQLDLDNNGKSGEMPGDAWGFGQYHGQYAFSLMSKYEIDTKNTRTFQHFKWKDLPSAENPVITVCDGSQVIPAGMKCGDNWYDENEWNQVRLSSKNHVDVPIMVPTSFGNQTLHLLLSHPTPPAFDKSTKHNYLKNKAEVQFWNDYISDNTSLYDDNGKKGGLKSDDYFVILGDLNVDPQAGDGDSVTINDLLNHTHVNTNATTGNLIPTSLGGAEHPSKRNANHPNKEGITSTFGLRVDHVIPSSNLHVINTGVYWPANTEQGRLLVNDERVGNGQGKAISSDHRMVWINVTMG